jgi:hypothetical protein
MRMQMAQQPVALAGHDPGQAFPALERQDTLVDRLATLRAMPSVQERRGSGFV